VLADLTPPSDLIVVATDQQEPPNAVRIKFDAAALVQFSATLGTTVIASPPGDDQLFTTMDSVLIFRPKGFARSTEEYKFVAVGGSGGASPAIASTYGTRLDGDFPQAAPALPSGDGAEGGDFVFRLLVK
jgi:hypothetical protein